ncbi:MAG: aromatic ring-hydroxylating dioxygenase subunit alpha [Gammaproteobacteria bacterium]|nr:aromatic ring-hydroxylating dioxygenase subunit alpha [Gammaproteobacteria bacterium]
MSKNAEYDYREGYVSYPSRASEGNIEQKADYIDYGTDRPSKDRYLSSEEWALEWEHVFRKTWLVAGVTMDLPSKGSYLKYDIGPESFVVVQTGETEADLKAYFNVCPHRGNQLVRDDFGTMGENFYCTFHGWKFDLDGNNIKVKNREIFREEVLSGPLCLKKVRCEVWNSIIFINIDGEARPLVEYLDVIPDHLKAYPFGEFRVLRDFEADWPANWKTAMDAFIEFYHSEDVHPELRPVMTTINDVQYDLYENGMSRMFLELGNAPLCWPDREAVNDAQKAFIELYGGSPEKYEGLKGYEYKSALVETKREWGRKHGYGFFDLLTDDQITDDWNYHLFPNVTLNCFSDGLLIQQWKPHPTDPNLSYYWALTLCLPVSDPEIRVMDINNFGPDSFGPPGWDGSERPDRDKPRWGVPEDCNSQVWGHVLWQDAQRVPNVHKGMMSEAFEGPLLSEAEVRIRHYQAEIDRLIGRAK